MPPRTTNIPPSSASALRQPSLNLNPSQSQSQSQSHSQSQSSSLLTSRIAAKKAELEHLKSLRDLSGALAAQMQALEEKLATLRDGTEAVAVVLANWENVLRAIGMASTKAATLKFPGAEDEGVGVGIDGKEMGDVPLPVTLVRIPVESQGQSSAEGAETSVG